jgi:probable HAF family extracellular repeat protein
VRHHRIKRIVWVAAVVLAGSFARAANGDAIYSITDLGAVTPTANVSGGNQSTPSSQYPFLSGVNLLNTNGNYLSLLSPSEQAAFQAGSFDLYAHPATTSQSGVFYNDGGTFDVYNSYQSTEYATGLNLLSSNNLGVSVGTANDNIPAAGTAFRLAEFTSDPHTIDNANSSYILVQSPGYLALLQTHSDQTYGQFYGTPSGINDHNVIALTEYQYNGAGPTVLVPHVYGLPANNGFPSDTSLGSLGGTNGAAYALNNSNEVVGWSQIANGSVHAFLWSNGIMQDLNLLIPPSSGITLVSAVGIDSAGDIVAYGTNASGQSHEYLLTPLEAPVPEPGSIAIFALSIVALVAKLMRAR